MTCRDANRYRVINAILGSRRNVPFYRKVKKDHKKSSGNGKSRETPILIGEGFRV